MLADEALASFHVGDGETALRNALARYFEDRKRGKFEFHMATVEPPARR